MVKYFLFMHIMVANPTGQVPNVYDFWFTEPELRYYATEKDCITNADQVMIWAKNNMESKKLTVLKTWYECVGKDEQVSFNHKPRGHKKL